MTHKERFRAAFSGEPVDRVPVYFFGTWPETKVRWKKEGLDTIRGYNDPGPQVPGMDPDWEEGLWDYHGLLTANALGNIQPEIIEETGDYLIHRTSEGDIRKDSKLGSSIPQFIKHGLEPTRESWNTYKVFLNPKDPRRYKDNWEQKAQKLNSEDRVAALMGGSLYGWLRGFMGIENLSYLMYDDAGLFEEIIGYMADYFITLLEPVVKRVQFDLVYIFEDCCGSNGPLFSPKVYKTVFDKYYKKLIGFYKGCGIPFIMVDSDGKVDQLIPLWFGSGFDIIFPLEVGKWNANPAEMRNRFGNRLKIFGGVNKHVITQGENAIRQHLEQLKPAVRQGGYIPIPDHRIPPDCSYSQFLTYIRVFNEVFNNNN
jgi:hypothetical protein